MLIDDDQNQVLDDDLTLEPTRFLSEGVLSVAIWDGDADAAHVRRSLRDMLDELLEGYKTKRVGTTRYTDQEGLHAVELVARLLEAEAARLRANWALKPPWLEASP